MNSHQLSQVERQLFAFLSLTDKKKIVQSIAPILSSTNENQDSVIIESRLNVLFENRKVTISHYQLL